MPETNTTTSTSTEIETDQTNRFKSWPVGLMAAGVWLLAYVFFAALAKVAQASPPRPLLELALFGITTLYLGLAVLTTVVWLGGDDS